jgi:dethiobiotin synthetase/adenosylmethionine--8-amino-7-oxononanoate aminotransferase
MHHWSSSLPPHKAAESEAAPISDNDLTIGLEREMRAFSNSIQQRSAGSTVPEPQLFTVVETAGGVLSPGPSKTLQADIYRKFRLPIILVGDCKLGGITTTLSAYESLRLRGYTVHAIVMIEHSGTDKYGNVVMIRDHLQRSLSMKDDTEYDNNGSMPLWAVNQVPKVVRMSPLPSDKLLHNWFKENATEFEGLFDHVAAAVSDENKRLMTMRGKGQNSVWWPFTQHAAVGDGDVTFIESAHGDKFRVISPVKEKKGTAINGIEAETKVDFNDLFDGCGSWWTQGVGHGNPAMSLAIAEAAGRYGHVMFPSNLHPPAVQLAEYLLEKGPGRDWAHRVFYSDDGSTGMEVAIKMAMRLWDVRKKSKGLNSVIDSEDINVNDMKNIIVLTQKDCYHGDTLGTMDTAESGPFNQSQHPWYRPRTAALPLPMVAFRSGKLTIDATDASCNIECSPNNCACAAMATATKLSGTWTSIDSVMNVKAREGSELEKSYRTFIQTYLKNCEIKGSQIGALLIEPLMLGAGGLKFIDPIYQKVLVQECRVRGIPIVYDEVAVGMYRLGPTTTSSILGEYPDIAVYGKLLSGGYMPLAATLATTEVFNAFLGKKKWHALLHGHSFTANPIACAAALESIRLLEGGRDNTWYDPSAFAGHGGVRSSFLEGDIRDISLLPSVKAVMSLGSVLSVELKSSSDERPQLKFSDPFVTPHMSDSETGLEIVTPSDLKGDDVDTLLDNKQNARYYNNNASAIVVSLLKENNVYARPLGNIVYLMPTPLTPEADRQRLIRVIKR